MDKDYGKSITSEYSSDISVDDILKEYLAQEEAARKNAAADVDEVLRRYFEREEELSAPEEEPEQSFVPEEDVKVYEPPKSRVARMAEEALNLDYDGLENYGTSQQDYYDESQQDYYDESQQDYYDESQQDYYDESQQDYYDESQQDYYDDSQQDYYDESQQDYYGDSDYKADDEIPVDPRFNLGGHSHSRTMRYGGDELDISSDDDYTPPPQSDSPMHWAEGDGEETEEKIPQKGKKSRKKAKKDAKSKKKQAAEEAPLRSYTDEEYRRFEEFMDSYAAPGEYAPDMDYQFAQDSGEYIKDEDTFPSFKEYVLGLLTSVIFRVSGSFHNRSGSSATMVIEEEDLGKEVTPMAAFQYYNYHLSHLRFRLRIVLVLMVVMGWISFGLPLPGTLKSVRVASGMLLAAQLTVMLLGLDIVTGAALNITRRRFGADTMAVLACILTGIDALGCVTGYFGSAHMPLCFVSSLLLTGVYLSTKYNISAIRRAVRAPAIGKRCYSVSGETGVKGKDITLLKSDRSPKGFVRRSEERPLDEEFFVKACPFICAAALLFSLIVCLVRKCWGDWLYVITAMLCAALPLTALMGFALPYFVGSNRIFKSGAAIAGWSGVLDIGQSKNLIVTDRDLFPNGTVSIDKLRIFANKNSNDIISYAGTLIVASGSCCASCFGEFMKKYGASTRRVDGFQHLAGGGMTGVIEGHSVLCGGVELMRLMNVKVPYKLVDDKPCVLLAVDGVLYGIFTMNYQGRKQERSALIELIKSNRHPIFAIRDFNVTPQMLERVFDVPTDGYDFPPYLERLKITEAEADVSRDSNISAVVCLEGLGPLTHMADTGRSIYIACRINVYIAALAAVLGLLTVFIKLLTGGGISLGFLTVFALVWALPVVIISIFFKF